MKTKVYPKCSKEFPLLYHLERHLLETHDERYSEVKRITREMIEEMKERRR